MFPAPNRPKTGKGNIQRAIAATRTMSRSTQPFLFGMIRD
jgi:hypothetical protein